MFVSNEAHHEKQVNKSKGNNLIMNERELYSPPASAWFGLGVLVATMVFGFINTQMIVLLIEQLRHSFSLSDASLGTLQGVGISLCGGVAAIPLGWLADRFDRRVVLATCVLVWSAATACCGLAGSFGALFVGVAILGAAQGILMPATYGLIPAMFSPARRALANSIYGVCAALGVGAGIAIGGGIVHIAEFIRSSFPAQLAQYDLWRISFALSAVPGPILALLILLMRLNLTDAAGASEEEHEVERCTLASYLRRHRVAVIGFFSALGFSNLAIAAVMNWLPAVIMRRFGVQPEQVGGTFGVVFSLSSVGAFLISGLVVPKLRGLGRYFAPAKVCTAVLFASAVLTLGMLFAATITYIYVALALQLVATMIALMIFPTILQGISPSHLRSRVAAVCAFIVLLISAFSPALVGLVSDFLGSTSNSLLQGVVAVAAVAYAISALSSKWSERAIAVVTEEVLADQELDQSLRMTRDQDRTEGAHEAWSVPK
ncbi:MFS transporter [Burkholderia pyrrocinia]|uniref:MFS transporter n=1 Tax=Burkholderia pyrrocinia TaxID=60550 RepID=UPI002AB11D24|nr:MFS transporter [Burkholderia pyrrocinia]